MGCRRALCVIQFKQKVEFFIHYAKITS
jgi:hypothetical protein